MHWTSHELKPARGHSSLYWTKTLILNSVANQHTVLCSWNFKQLKWVFSNAFVILFLLIFMINFKHQSCCSLFKQPQGTYDWLNYTSSKYFYFLCHLFVWFETMGRHQLYWIASLFYLFKNISRVYLCGWNEKVSDWILHMKLDWSVCSMNL